MHRKTAPALVIVLLALAAISVWSAPQAGPRADSKEVSDLLAQAKTQAAQLSRDASDMEGFTHVNVSLQTHANQINSIRSDVNDMGKTVVKLNAAQADGSPQPKSPMSRPGSRGLQKI